jgi:hypothetical protein
VSRRRPRRDQTAAPPPADRDDLAAARALRDAGGRCARCEQMSPALVAVPAAGGGFEAVCVALPACTRRARESLRREEAS